MKKKSLNIILNLLICFMVLIFIYCVYKIVISFLEYKEVDDTYKGIFNKVVTLTEEVDSTNESINWEELKKINSDVIAWIYIPNSNINYPVVQCNDNEYYINNNISKKRSKGGCIFVDSRINSPFEALNTIVYGHNLKNGAMFSELEKYKNEEFLKEHPYVYIYLPDGEILKYKVFSFSIAKVDDTIIYDYNVFDINKYFKSIEQYNKIKNIEQINGLNKILTLSTCTNNNEYDRYVVHAYLEK